MTPKLYIHKLVDTHVKIFGTKPKQLVMSPLEKGDHPELDMSKELGEDGIRDYQSLISAFNGPSLLDGWILPRQS